MTALCRLRLFGHTLYLEKSGVISQNSCWVCFYSSYMHADESLARLLWSLLTEYESDKHLVGW